MADYLRKSFLISPDEYNPSTNPDGYINLSIAENVLSLGLVVEKLSATLPIPANQLRYGNADRLACAVAKFFQTHITSCATDPKHITILNGGTSVLDTLATVLCDAGDRVLITGPGYRGFELDFGGRAGAELVTACLEGEFGTERAPLMSVHALEEAWIKAGGDDSRIRAAVICSPNNPTGEVLRREVISEIVQWGQGRRVHVIFDELYAKSVYTDNVQFVSVAEVMGGNMGDYVHVVWSFSKDFCVSGCRVGVLYSQNEEVLECITSFLSFFSMPSRHTQWALEHMLNDETWIQEFLEENKKRLAEAYKMTTQNLNRLGIPFLKAEAGFFVWVDLRKWMKGSEVEHEMDLWERLLETKLLLTPSNECFGRRYGYFRICFSAVDAGTLELAWERMAALVGDGGHKCT